MTNLFFFIAGRVGKSDKRSRESVAGSVAVVSVAVSVAVMFITVCVVSGFRAGIETKIAALAADFRVTHAQNPQLFNLRSIDRNLPAVVALDSAEYVENVAPFVAKAVIVKVSEVAQGGFFKGVDQRSLPAIAPYLKAGNLPAISDSVRSKEVLIPLKMAQKLHLAVGDPIEVYFPDREVRRDRVVVSGIYDLALGEVDRSLIIGDMRLLQRINGWSEDQVTGFDILLNPHYPRTEAADALAELFYGDRVQPAEELLTDSRDTYQSLFEWLNLQTVNETVVIVIMLTVSLFTVLAMVLILLMRHTAAIGTLQSLGMKNGTIQLIFMIRSTRILLGGMIAGNIVAAAVCLLQQRFGWIRLDSDSYLTDAVPIVMRVEEILQINLLMIVAILVIQYLTTKIIISTQPYISLKYEQRQ